MQLLQQKEHFLGNDQSAFTVYVEHMTNSKNSRIFPLPELSGCISLNSVCIPKILVVASVEHNVRGINAEV
jgi:hypothetical protein